jgi:hypothetical protein
VFWLGYGIHHSLSDVFWFQHLHLVYHLILFPSLQQKTSTVDTWPVDMIISSYEMCCDIFSIDIVACSDQNLSIPRMQVLLNQLLQYFLISGAFLS